MKESSKVRFVMAKKLISQLRDDKEAMDRLNKWIKEIKIRRMKEEKPLSEKVWLDGHDNKFLGLEDVTEAVEEMKKLNTITEEDLLRIFGDLKGEKGE